MSNVLDKIEPVYFPIGIIYFITSVEAIGELANLELKSTLAGVILTKVQMSFIVRIHLEKDSMWGD